MAILSAALALAVALAISASGVDAQPATGHLGLIVPRYLVAGGEPSTVAAQVVDGAGVPAPDGTVVAFVATLGLRFEPAQVATRDGLAVTRLVPGTEAGFARLDAVSGATRANVLVWVRPAPAAYVLWLRAEPENLTTSAGAALEARLTDRYGNLAEGDAVSWQAGGGTVTPDRARVIRGVARATFTAGPAPGPAWVLLRSDGPSARVAIPIRGELDRSALTKQLYLPCAARRAEQTSGCRDELANGSFEEDADADGLPEPWEVESTAGAVSRSIGDALDGRYALRFEVESQAPPPVARQTMVLGTDAKSAQLRLWVRGGAVGAEIRVGVWAMIDFGLGSGPARVPLLLERVPVTDRDWTLLVFPLPLVPTGLTTLELSPRLQDDGPAAIEVDAVRLETCR